MAFVPDGWLLLFDAIERAGEKHVEGWTGEERRFLNAHRDLDAFRATARTIRHRSFEGAVRHEVVPALAPEAVERARRFNAAATVALNRATAALLQIRKWGYADKITGIVLSDSGRTAQFRAWADETLQWWQILRSGKAYVGDGRNVFGLLLINEAELTAALGLAETAADPIINAAPPRPALRIASERHPETERLPAVAAQPSKKPAGRKKGDGEIDDSRWIAEARRLIAEGRAKGIHDAAGMVVKTHEHEILGQSFEAKKTRLYRKLGAPDSN